MVHAQRRSPFATYLAFFASKSHTFVDPEQDILSYGHGDAVRNSFVTTTLGHNTLETAEARETQDNGQRNLLSCQG